MERYQIRLYQNEDFALWNDFISKAKNATFLFHRNFMEYHKDRFEDYSLMVFKDEKLVAVLPANRVGDTMFSHQGLTYGGLVFSMKSKSNDEYEIVNELVSFLKLNSIKEFVFKQLPIFYFSKVSNEMDYFLFQKGAKLYRKDMNLAIHLTLPLHISKSKLKHFNKVDENMKMVEETDFSPFWEQVLQPRLAEKHATKPVHNLEEIHRLKSNFPNNIRQFSAYYDDKIVAGITIFDSGLVVKSQYGATTLKGEDLRALDFLFITLIYKYQSEGKHYFDMGIVNENEGRDFNKGLLNQKEELGCSVYNQDYYKWTFND